jgi:hypothetical protein
MKNLQLVPVHFSLFPLIPPPWPGRVAVAAN